MCPCKPPAAALAAGQRSTEPRGADGTGKQDSSQGPGGAEGGGRGERPHRWAKTPGQPRCVCPTAAAEREKRGEASTGGPVQLPAPAERPARLFRDDPPCAGRARVNAPAAGPGRAAGFNPVRGD